MGDGGCEQRYESVGADDDSGWISALAARAGQDSAVLLRLAGPSPEEQWKNRGEEPAREDEGMRAVEFLVLMRDAVSIQ